MIGLIAGFLVKRSLAKGGAMALPHARRLAKAGLVVAAVVALAIGIAVTVWLIRRDAVADHNAERVTETLKAERRANTNDEIRQQAREDASTATTEQLETIHAQDPEAAARPAPAGSRAVADRLRPQ